MLFVVDHFILICQNTNPRLIYDPTNPIYKTKIVAGDALLGMGFLTGMNVDINMPSFFSLGPYLSSPKLRP